MTYSPLMQGLLTGRYANPDEVPDGLARTRHFSSDRPMASHGQPGMEDELFAVIAQYQKVCEGMNQEMAHVALAWVKQQEGITTILLGARSADEVAMNLPAFDLTISDDAAQETRSNPDRRNNGGIGNPEEAGEDPSRWSLQLRRSGFERVA